MRIQQARAEREREGAPDDSVDEEVRLCAVYRVRCALAREEDRVEEARDGEGLDEEEGK